LTCYVSCNCKELRRLVEMLEGCAKRSKKRSENFSLLISSRRRVNHSLASKRDHLELVYLHLFRSESKEPKNTTPFLSNPFSESPFASIRQKPIVANPLPPSSPPSMNLQHHSSSSRLGARDLSRLSTYPSEALFRNLGSSVRQCRRHEA